MESVVSGLRGYWLCLAHLTSTIRNIHLIHLSSVVAEGCRGSKQVASHAAVAVRCECAQLQSQFFCL